MIARDEFLEWAVFNGNYYGTSKRDVQSFLSQGRSVIKEIDVQGMKQLDKKRRAIGGRLISLFILPPSLAELKRRLSGRGTESRSRREERLKAAQEELKSVEFFDFLLFNREQDNAIDTLVQIVTWNCSQK